MEVEPSSNIGVTLSHELVFSCVEEDNQAPWKCYVSNQLYASDAILASHYLLNVDCECFKGVNLQCDTCYLCSLFPFPAGGLSQFQPIQLVQNALPISQSVLVGDTVQFQCFAIGW